MISGAPGVMPISSVRSTATRLRIGVGAFQRRAQEALGEGDLSAPQLTALARLDRGGPVTTAELARRAQITPQAMGATVAGLEHLGLVARTADATDGRRVILTLTRTGRAAVVSGRSAIADKMALAMRDSFTAAEVATLDAAAPLIERLAGLI